MFKKGQFFSINKQLIAVFIFAVILPLVIVTFILININQIAVRKEITYATTIFSRYVDGQINNNLERFENEAIKLLAFLDSVEPTPEEIDEYTAEYFKDFLAGLKIREVKSGKTYQKGEIVTIKENNTIMLTDKHLVIMKENKNYGVTFLIQLPWLLKNLRPEVDAELDRHIKIMDFKGRILWSSHGTDKERPIDFELDQIGDLQENEFFLFGTKNEPSLAVVPDKRLPIIALILTPEDVSYYGTVKSRYRIILILILSAIVTIIIGIIYSSTLNRNIRQFGKALSAVKSGHYTRKIHLITNIFTPSELVYITDEFNSMAEHINKAWQEVNKKNKELSDLDEAKSNLIETVSHELRTPLTSINGHTSSLIRNDEKLDKEAKLKSLKIIKQQATLLNRMVDDLLVVPEIEYSTLRIVPSNLEIEPILKHVMSSLQLLPESVDIEVGDNIPKVIADPERLEQVLINLLSNAQKYGLKGSPIKIKIDYESQGGMVRCRIFNCCDPIDRDKADMLFKKFSRIDNTLTRTSRGTGLGLFITKGLINAMGGVIALNVEEGFEVLFYLPACKPFTCKPFSNIVSPSKQE